MPDQRAIFDNGRITSNLNKRASMFQKTVNTGRALGATATEGGRGLYNYVNSESAPELVQSHKNAAMLMMGGPVGAMIAKSMAGEAKKAFTNMYSTFKNNYKNANMLSSSDARNMAPDYNNDGGGGYDSGGSSSGGSGGGSGGRSGGGSSGRGGGGRKPPGGTRRGSSSNSNNGGNGGSGSNNNSNRSSITTKDNVITVSNPKPNQEIIIRDTRGNSRSSKVNTSNGSLLTLQKNASDTMINNMQRSSGGGGSDNNLSKRDLLFITYLSKSIVAKMERTEKKGIKSLIKGALGGMVDQFKNVAINVFPSLALIKANKYYVQLPRASKVGVFNAMNITLGMIYAAIRATQAESHRLMYALISINKLGFGIDANIKPPSDVETLTELVAHGLKKGLVDMPLNVLKSVFGGVMLFSKSKTDPGDYEKFGGVGGGGGGGGGGRGPSSRRKTAGEFFGPKMNVLKKGLGYGIGGAGLAQMMGLGSPLTGMVLPGLMQAGSAGMGLAGMAGSGLAGLGAGGIAGIAAPLLAGYLGIKGIKAFSGTRAGKWTGNKLAGGLKRLPGGNKILGGMGRIKGKFNNVIDKHFTQHFPGSGGGGGGGGTASSVVVTDAPTVTANIVDLKEVLHKDNRLIMKKIDIIVKIMKKEEKERAWQRKLDMFNKVKDTAMGAFSGAMEIGGEIIGGIGSVLLGLGLGSLMGSFKNLASKGMGALSKYIVAPLSKKLSGLGTLISSKLGVKGLPSVFKGMGKLASKAGGVATGGLLTFAVDKYMGESTEDAAIGAGGTMAGATLGLIGGPIGSIIGGMVGGWLADHFAPEIKGAIGWVTEKTTTAFRWLKDTTVDIWDYLVDSVVDTKDYVVDKVTGAILYVKEGFLAIKQTVYEKFGNIKQWIGNKADDISEMVYGLFGGISGAVAKIISFIPDFAKTDALRSLESKMNAISQDAGDSKAKAQRQGERRFADFAVDAAQRQQFQKERDELASEGNARASMIEDRNAYKVEQRTERNSGRIAHRNERNNGVSAPPASIAAAPTENTTSSMLSNAWDGTKSMASSAWEGTKTVASDMYDGGTAIASNIWKSTESARTSASNYVSSAVSSTTGSISSFVSGGDGWQMLTGGVGQITSPYGPRTHPTTGEKNKMHKGIDIGAPAGTPVHAFDSGIVKFAGTNGNYGNIIIVEHANGLSTAYAHLSQMNVQVGQSINKGDVIGAVGHTGRGTGDHLHFEIRKDGQHVDPMPILNDGISGSVGRAVEQIKGISKEYIGKLPDSFLTKASEVASNLNMDPNTLMSIMDFESGINAQAVNKKSGATGLIQFMPDTAKGLGTSISELKNMSPEQQLDYVQKYFEPYKGKIKDVSDAYMAVLWPNAVGKPADHVLWKRGSKQYEQNPMDWDNDGLITKAEASRKVLEKYAKSGSSMLQSGYNTAVDYAKSGVNKAKTMYNSYMGSNSEVPSSVGAETGDIVTPTSVSQPSSPVTSASTTPTMSPVDNMPKFGLNSVIETNQLKDTLKGGNVNELLKSGFDMAGGAMGGLSDTMRNGFTNLTKNISAVNNSIVNSSNNMASSTTAGKQTGDGDDFISKNPGLLKLLMGEI